MAKKVKNVVKILIKAGAANPAPPVGSTLGPYGLNLMEFCNEFNAKTNSMGDTLVPAEVTIYEDRSYSLLIKTPPASALIKKAAGIKSGSGNPLKDKVGVLSLEQLKEIAEKKMTDLNCYDLREAMLMVAGTCRSMGVKTPEIT